MKQNNSSELKFNDHTRTTSSANLCKIGRDYYFKVKFATDEFKNG